MKKNIIYVVLLGIGVLVGAFIFGGGNVKEVGEHGGHQHGKTADSSKWTCSMHPQIQKIKPGKCPICAMDLVGLKKGASKNQRPRELVMSQAARELARISTVPVKRQWVDARIDLVGKIDYDETRTKTIAAWFPARIDKLYVDYTGVDVRKDDHLAYVYSPELLTAQSELITAIKFKSEDISTIKDKLRLWGLSDEKIKSIEAKGEIDDHMDIDAPFGGIVIHKGVNEGDYVKTGEPLFRIADLRKVWVQLDAYESDLPWLRYGQKVEFQAEAVPGKKFEGVITFISPILDPKTRTVKVRVNADNTELVLKPEMFVRATALATLAGGGKVISQDLAGKWIGPMHPEVLQDKPGDCPICGMKLAKAETLGYSVAKHMENPPLVVPSSAVLKTGKRSVVYVENLEAEEPTYEGREVLVGPKAGGFYIIEEGLEEGDQVVTEGNFKIDSALQILAKPSMMNHKGGGGGGHQHGGIKKMEPDKMNHNGMETTRYEVSDEFKQQLSPIFAEFFKVQSSLANDDYEKARSAAEALDETLGGVDMKTLKGEAHLFWMKNLPAIKDAIGKIVDGKDIGAVREAFEALSGDISKVAMTFGIQSKVPVVIVHCSMAFDGKGANWMQAGDQIRNPYYGKAMSSCGSVKTEIK